MIVYQKLAEFTVDSNKPLTVVLGNFDGIHLGHQNLIKMATNTSRQIKGETLILTFYPPPQLLFNPDFKMLSSLEFKIEFFEKLNINKCLIIPFTQEFAQLTPEEFVKEILFEKIGAKNLVCGFNYSFGHKGAGTATDLINLAGKFGQEVKIMEPFYIKDKLASSTRIRELIDLGEMEEAKDLLGYNPRIKGTVIPGNKIGRKIGFPTVNLAWDEQLMVPGVGVYIVEIKIGSCIKKGVANIGYKPTISTNNKHLTIEAHIFDFKEDIYDTKIELIFNKKIRNELVFSSLEHLKQQISMDKIMAKNYFLKET